MSIKIKSISVGAPVTEDGNPFSFQCLDIAVAILKHMKIDTSNLICGGPRVLLNWESVVVSIDDTDFELFFNLFRDDVLAHTYEDFICSGEDCCQFEIKTKDYLDIFPDHLQKYDVEENIDDVCYFLSVSAESFFLSADTFVMKN